MGGVAVRGEAGWGSGSSSRMHPRDTSAAPGSATDTGSDAVENSDTSSASGPDSSARSSEISESSQSRLMLGRRSHGDA